MRQLLAEGWMHNRVRMVVGVVPRQGPAPGLAARRPALHATGCATATSRSNQHGWQWVAGTGTDAAPYFRVFNPVTQGLKFDPDGDYVRRYVPELRRRRGRRGARAVEGAATASPAGYPQRIVDHAAERPRPCAATRRLATEPRIPAGRVSVLSARIEG